jgi:hypothetical protein
MGVDYWCVTQNPAGDVIVAVYAGKNLDPDRIEVCRKMLEMYDYITFEGLEEYVDTGTLNVISANLRRAVFEVCDNLRILTAAVMAERFGCRIYSEDFLDEVMNNVEIKRAVFVDPSVGTAYVKVQKDGQWVTEAEF